MSNASNDLLVEPTKIIAKLKSYRWAIFSVAILGAVAGFGAVKFQVGWSPTYTSSTDIRILPSRAELIFARESLGGSSTAQTTALIRTFKGVIRSDEVMRSALANMPNAPLTYHADGGAGCSGIGGVICTILGTGANANALAAENSLDFYREAIAINDVEGSFIMRLSVTLPDRQASADFANGLIKAYNASVLESDDSVSAMIGNDFVTRLSELESQYEGLLKEEISLRETIGALSLEADVTRLQNLLQTQSAALNQDEIELVALERRLSALKVARAPQQVAEASPAAESAIGGAPSGLAAPVRPTPSPLSLGAIRLPTQPELIQVDIDALEVQIETRQRIIMDLRSEIEGATRKQITLRPVVTEQAAVLDSISDIKSRLYAPSTTNVSNAATAAVLRSAGAPLSADPPSAIQAGLVGGVGSMILASLLLALGTLLSGSSAAPAPAPAQAPRWTGRRDENRTGRDSLAADAPQAKAPLSLEEDDRIATAIQAAAKAARQRSTGGKGSSDNGLS